MNKKGLWERKREVLLDGGLIGVGLGLVLSLIYLLYIAAAVSLRDPELLFNWDDSFPFYIVLAYSLFFGVLPAIAIGFFTGTVNLLSYFGLKPTSGKRSKRLGYLASSIVVLLFLSFLAFPLDSFAYKWHGSALNIFLLLLVPFIVYIFVSGIHLEYIYNKYHDFPVRSVRRYLINLAKLSLPPIIVIVVLFVVRVITSRATW